MKNKFFKPYDIDIEYELRTYKNVGKDYGNRKVANLGCILNIKRFLRKKGNKQQTKYKFCNTHSEWEEHVQSIFVKDIINYSDLLYWLHGECNNAKNYLEAFKTILIPIYVTIISISDIFWGDVGGWLSVLLSMIVIVYKSTKELIKASTKVHFYEDLILLLEEEPV